MTGKFFRSLLTETRQILTLSLTGAVGCWLASLADVLFTGKLSLAEALGSLFLFAVAGLIVAIPLRLLTEFSSHIDGLLQRFRLPVAAVVTLAAIFPLACLLFTRSSWTYEFLAISLLITAAMFPAAYFAWKFVHHKTLWLLSALFSTWLFYSVVDNEGLLMRAGVELLDLPTLVLFVITAASAATGFLLARLGQSLKGRPPAIVEAALLFGGGLLLAVFAGDAIDIHYENIFRVTAFFSFLAVMHGLSIIPPKLPLKISLPLMIALLTVGVLLVVPFDGKPKGLSLVHAKLAQKNRTVAEIFKMTGLAEGEQRVAVCRLDKLGAYPTGDFARRFKKSLKTARHRPELEELNADPQRRIVDPDKPWNFLMITVDALRYDKTSYSGLTGRNKTPAFERLARESQRFHGAYPQGAWTTLSVPALLFSKFPKDIKYTPIYEDNGLRLYLPKEVTKKVQIKREFQIPVDKSPNLPGVLTQAGFTTVSVTNDGSTGFFDPRLGMTMGFSDIRYPGKEGSDTEALREAEEALKSVKDNPFFMWVHFFDVHSCHKRPKDKEEKKRYRSYDYRVSKVDEKTGRLLDLLEELGLKENTVVILTGDHGQSMGEQGQKGHGLALNDASLHVPLLIRVPGLPPANYNRLVSLVDMAPTILDLAGQGERVPDGWVGTSLAPMLAAGKDLDHPPVYVETWRNKVQKKEKILHLSGLMYENRKVTIKLDDMEMSFYDDIPRKPAREKQVYPEIDHRELRDDQLYMTKHLLDRNHSIIEKKCR